MGKRKSFTGKVISDKMQKTIIVRTERLMRHPKYSRIIKQYNKFKVHDEQGLAKTGDIVRIEETRPLSKEKCFRLVGVLKKANLASIDLEREETGV